MADEGTSKTVTDHSNLRESSEHNFALKQITGIIVNLKRQRDNYYTDLDCPTSLVNSFDFALDALKILCDDIRDFNGYCTARRHNNLRLNPKEKKPRVRRINVT